MAAATVSSEPTRTRGWHPQLVAPQLTLWPASFLVCLLVRQKPGAPQKTFVEPTPTPGCHCMKQGWPERSCRAGIGRCRSGPASARVWAPSPVARNGGHRQEASRQRAAGSGQRQRATMRAAQNFLLRRWNEHHTFNTKNRGSQPTRTGPRNG